MLLNYEFDDADATKSSPDYLVMLSSLLSLISSVFNVLVFRQTFSCCPAVNLSIWFMWKQLN